jgi:DNA polymerase III subunit beta
MKFIVSSKALLNQLSLINGAISSSPTIPILENFLFEIKDGELTATATDLQMTMITQLPVESKDESKVCVPAKILLETLRNLADQPVALNIDEDTYTIEISSDNGRYKLAGENAADFPKIPASGDGNVIEVPSNLLGRAISKTLFATSSDELRPAMTGVLVQLKDSSITFASTDGHRLVRYRRVDVASKNESSIILPKKALSLLKSTLPSELTAVSFEFSASNAIFTFDNVKMICRLIAERYPDYENVIPLTNPNQLVINRLSLLSTLKRIVIYANKTTSQIRFKIAGSEIQVSAEDLDFSNEANERLACQFTGEDMEIGFNAKFLIEILSNLDSEEVSINMSLPNKAALILPAKQDNNEDILMLAMPVMLNKYV